MQTFGPNKEIKIFFDLLCPDSRDAERVLQEFIDTPVDSRGFTYVSRVTVRVTPFVLPYHTFSY